MYKARIAACRLIPTGKSVGTGTAGLGVVTRCQYFFERVRSASTIRAIRPAILPMSEEFA